MRKEIWYKQVYNYLKKWIASNLDRTLKYYSAYYLAIYEQGYEQLENYIVDEADKEYAQQANYGNLVTQSLAYKNKNFARRLLNSKRIVDILIKRDEGWLTTFRVELRKQMTNYFTENELNDFYLFTSSKKQ